MFKFFVISISITMTACGGGEAFTAGSSSMEATGGSSVLVSSTGGQSSVTATTGGSTTADTSTGGNATLTTSTGGSSAADTSCKIGTVGCPCYDNDTCNSDGQCFLGTCLLRASGTGGNTGTGGSSAKPNGTGGSAPQATGGTPATGGTTQVATTATGGNQGTGGSRATGGTTSFNGHTCNQLYPACSTTCQSAQKTTCIYLSAGATVLDDNACNAFWNSYCTSMIGTGGSGTGGSSGTGGTTSTGGTQATGGSSSTGGATSNGTNYCSNPQYKSVMESYKWMPGIGACYHEVYKKLTVVAMGCSDVGTTGEIDILPYACPTSSNLKVTCTAGTPALSSSYPNDSSFTISYYENNLYSWSCNNCNSGWTCS